MATVEGGNGCAPQISRPAENCREFVNSGSRQALASCARFGMRMLVLVDRRHIVRLLRDAQVRCSSLLAWVAAAENRFFESSTPSGHLKTAVRSQCGFKKERFGISVYGQRELADANR